MRPEIADFIRLIYNNYKDYDSVKYMDNIKGVG